MNIYWLLSARERLRAELNGQPIGLDDRLSELDTVLNDVFAGHVVIVRDRYSGYRPFTGLVVLLVEVHPVSGAHAGRFPSPGTYIVKIAFHDQPEALKDLKKEIEAWNTARPRHFNSDNVFVSLAAHPDETAPTALVYGHADAVLGERNTMSLEDAITQACRFGVPKPQSVERILRALYDRLYSHFFVHSHPEEAPHYFEETKPNLREVIIHYDENAPAAPDPKHKHDSLIQQIRRETLGLLAADHEQFADPIDLLRGLQKAGIGPQVLRGTAHGDLHARNIQVAILDDEVSQCAVFDYEKFSTSNFVAWDFIKFEIETAVRLLDRFGETAMSAYARECTRFWRRVSERAAASDPQAPLPPVPGAEPLGKAWKRLENLLVAVRLLARKHLGSKGNRAYEWEAEYEFLMAWYAARAVLYPNYQPRWRVAALTAGGVAARHLIRRMPAEVELSHRRRFVEAKNLARGIDTIAAGAAKLRSLAQEFPHVLEIQEELALAAIKLQQFTEAEEVLENIARRYRTDHTTAETPALLGSLWKRRAFATEPYDRYALERALTWYQRAAERHNPDEFYPRINVATLLLLQNNPVQARSEAQRVLELIEQQKTPSFWAMASRGEAMLLLGGEDISAALMNYRHAINDRDCRPMDRKSMRDQILLLRPHLPLAVQNHLTDSIISNLFQIPQEAK